MLEIKRYQVDAFADAIFKGNPAAVCPLESWLPDDVLQNIALENNLSETAFIVDESGSLRIRWFTPEVEVDLCGHATLASAFVLFNYEGFKKNVIEFNSRSGLLKVTRKSNLLMLDFPADEIGEIPVIPQLTEAFVEKPTRIFQGKTDLLFVYEDEDQIRRADPDITKLSKIKVRGIIITARGKDVDFVSRFFGPNAGVIEDPVTGSAHTTLTPYWSKIMDKTSFKALQLSKRGGQLFCELKGNRVEISGKAQLFSKGTIYLPD